MKRKRHWYNNYNWQNIPFAILYLMGQNLKTIFYIITIGFIVFQVSKMAITTEASADMQAILQEQKDQEIQEEFARQKLLRYKAEAESRAREELEKQNAEYNKKLQQDFLTKQTIKIYPKGTYLRNKETKEVGQVKKIQGERVITTTFYFDAKNCQENEDVEFLSFKEYKRLIKKDLENKKLTSEEIRQRQEWLKECEAKDTEETKKIWKINDCFKYKGAMYEVKDIKGTTLYCLKAGTKSMSSNRFKYEVYAYAEGIERMDWHEFIRLS